MTTIAFIRHGVTDWNLERRAQGQSDVPLNEEGMLQAKALGRRFSGEKWDAIYTSDLSRAKTTAEAVAEVLDIQVKPDERLREISFGDMEGTTEEERVAQFGPGWKDRNLNIEKTDAVIERAGGFIEEIRSKHEGQKVIVVSHGAFLNDMFVYLLEQRFEKCRLDNTSLSIVEFTDQSCDMKLLNCTNHLSFIEGRDE
ncbi:histidine phosphatase family protein [Pseudalkalibacillus berkeleyi]|uniref:Histidine phosphatase family protein n=1 Tax=Pseudalkalibacillus berkeleyi TaxID=1069813 RepID=A0ABS9H521_9BACL|nr:histidine phosphatase family protein [Pseudalkalibacillus berkeleyi]MCF6138993.1 histidine phosphatase family protein [Pseudalkalibacillus berkeleyi]